MKRLAYQRCANLDSDFLLPLTSRQGSLRCSVGERLRQFCGHPSDLRVQGTIMSGVASLPPSYALIDYIYPRIKLRVQLFSSRIDLQRACIQKVATGAQQRF